MKKHTERRVILNSIILNKGQKNAKEGIIKWYKKQNEQIVTLAGFAGTGKTFLIQHIIEELKLRINEVAFATYTGKASLVLQRRIGRYRASTTHKLLYDVEVIGGRIHFSKKSKDKLKGIRLIIIDEASMIPKGIYDDLVDLGISILFVGDKGQLSSIEKEGENSSFDILANPDFSISEIVRQAEGNPIIHLSMLARENKKIQPGRYGEEVLVVRKGELKGDLLSRIYKNADQIICGYNQTRQRLNQEVRSLLGFKGDKPQVGEKLICTKNNWEEYLGDTPLINGMTGFVKGINYNPKLSSSYKRKAYTLDFSPDYNEKEHFNELVLLSSDFNLKKETLEYYEQRLYNRFDYGYSITCHKAQGSQYPNLFVVNEVLNYDTHKNWLYTAITRAEERLVLEI